MARAHARTHAPATIEIRVNANPSIALDGPTRFASADRLLLLISNGKRSRQIPPNPLYWQARAFAYDDFAPAPALRHTDLHERVGESV